MQRLLDLGTLCCFILHFLFSFCTKLLSCLSSVNRPFTNCLQCLCFENESKFETIQMKMSLIYMKMNMRVKLIFKNLVSHLDSSC